MPTPCQVDFYILSSSGLDPTRMACRLALMSWERGHRTVVVTDSANSARKLDALMWESPAERFLPHELTNEAGSATAPVLITSVDGMNDAGLNDCDVVINLCPRPVPEPNRYARLLEIVPQQNEARKASREKYRYYRDHGITPGSHEITTHG